MKKLKKIRPLLNHVITTADRYEGVQLKDGLVDASKEDGEIMEFQRVVAIGPNAYQGLNIGDHVIINPQRYMVPEHSLRHNSVMEKSKDEVNMIVAWPVINVNDEELLFITDSDIEVIVDEWEEIPEIIS